MAESENQELIERIEKLEKINKELKDEKSELKAKYKGVDVEEFLELKKQNDELESKLAKAEKANATLTKDFENLNNSLNEKDGQLSKLLIDDGIAKALNGLPKHKLKEHGLQDAINNIKENGIEIIDGKAVVGDKSLDDFIANDWVQNPRASLFIEQNPNVGGGANGGNGNGGNPTQGKLDGTKAEQEAYIKAKFNLEK